MFYIERLVYYQSSTNVMLKYLVMTWMNFQKFHQTYFNIMWKPQIVEHKYEKRYFFHGMVGSAEKNSMYTVGRFDGGKYSL